MNYNVYFSPTGITQNVNDFVCRHFSAGQNVDLSLETQALSLDEKDFCVVGVPSFGGRVPALAAKRLEQLRGSKTPAFLIVTYGGRAYEDTLKELKDILENQGFICIGAAAVVAEHSIVPEIAAGRPSKEDYKELENFLTVIQNRLQGEISSVEVPGKYPYKKYGVLPINIEVSDNCIKCGACADKCPVSAIPADNPKMTDMDKCITCMRCVSICPVKARTCDSERTAVLKEKLSSVYKPDLKNDFI